MMEIENLENQTSKLVLTTKRKSKKRNKNKQSEKFVQENGHPVKDEQVTVTAAAISSTTNENKNLDELTERLRSNSNGIVLTNGDHHESDDGVAKEDQATMSSPNSPMNNGDGESMNCQNLIDPKIESLSKSTNSSNFVSRKPSDENYKILENGCENTISNSPSETVPHFIINDIGNEPSSSLSSALIPNTSSTSSLTMIASKFDGEEKPIPTEIEYKEYESELQMPDIMRLIQKDLSEPYSIYTYRYFIHNWPKLCFLAYYREKCVGAIVCKLDMHRRTVKRGYIAMLAVDKDCRKLKIGSNLVQKAIQVIVFH